MPQLTQRYPAVGWVRPIDAPMKALQLENEKLREKIVLLTNLGKARSPSNSKLASVNAQTEDESSQLDVPVVRGDEVMTFDYRVHAYQDGNFRELRPRRKMTWNEIMLAVGPGFRPAAPEDAFARLLNDYLNISALKDVHEVMPRAHATARCQINVRALHAIKMQLKNNHWIVPIGRDDRHHILWGLSSVGEAHLNALMTHHQLETGS